MTHNLEVERSPASYWSGLWAGPLCFLIVAFLLVGSVTFWLLVGVAVWTLFEYAFHRWYMHGPMYGYTHAQHHDDPTAHVAITPWSVPIEALVFMGAYVFMGHWAGFLVLGFTIGSSLQFLVHSATHYLRPFKSHPLRHFQDWHMAHHHDPLTNFGVTTRFWDVAFRTARSPSNVRSA